MGKINFSACGQCFGNFSLLAALAVPLLTLTILSFPATAQEKSSATPRVQVKQVQLRKDPSALAPRIGELSYGQAVEILVESEDQWLKVRTVSNSEKASKDLNGWLRTSAIRPQGFRFDAQFRLTKSTPDSEEMAFAAKGLNELERELESTNKDLADAYKVVDKLEQSANSSVDYSELEKFMKTGNIKSEQQL